MSFPQLDDLYREVVLDHYRNPRGGEPLARCDLTNEGFNPVCGDEVTIGVQVEGGRIAGLEVHSRGCSISVASGSMLAELLRGKTLFEARLIAEDFRRMMHGEIQADDVDLGDLEALEGVQKFPVRVKCALLAWTTLTDALKAQGMGEPEHPSTTEDPKKGSRPGLVPSSDSTRRKKS